MQLEHLKAALKEAANLVSEVPQHLQPVAFTAAFDALTAAASRYQAGTTPRKTASLKTDAPNSERRPRAGRVGSKTALTELTTTEFFDAGKKVLDIQSHLDERKGLKYSSRDISKSALLLVRRGILARDRNPEGQYVYTKR